MSTTVYTHIFNPTVAGPDNLLDGGNSANITVDQFGDGDPSNNCLRFSTTTASLSSEVEYAIAASGLTWEDLGVPVGATVTAVQVTGIKDKASAVSSTSSVSAVLDLVDNSLASVMSGSMSSLPSYITTSSWTQEGSQTSRTVNSGKQTSNTQVRLKVTATISTGILSPSVDYRLDSIELTITYTPGTTAVSKGTAICVAAISFAITPSLLVLTIDFPNPTQFGSNQTVSPDILDLASTVFFPAIAGPKLGITPNVLSLDVIFFNPTITNGNIYVSPDVLILDSLVFPTPQFVGAPATQLQFSFCKDGAGSIWTDEVVVDTAIDNNKTAGTCLWGSQWIVAYNKNGKILIKRTPNPGDWSGGSIDTGATGLVLDMAVNNDGILMILSSGGSYGFVCGTLISRDGGLTWVSTVGTQILSPARIFAIENTFMIAGPSHTDGSIKYKISQDCGNTWQ